VSSSFGQFLMSLFCVTPPLWLFIHFFFQFTAFIYCFNSCLRFTTKIICSGVEAGVLCSFNNCKKPPMIISIVLVAY
jgi:hypothetical protein